MALITPQALVSWDRIYRISVKSASTLVLTEERDVAILVMSGFFQHHHISVHTSPQIDVFSHVPKCVLGKAYHTFTWDSDRELQARRLPDGHHIGKSKRSQRCQVRNARGR